MKKIKLFPAPHVELRVHVSDEMIADYKECEELSKGLDGKECNTCSWDKAEIGGVCMCQLVKKEQLLEDEDEQIN